MVAPSITFRSDPNTGMYLVPQGCFGPDPMEHPLSDGHTGAKCVMCGKMLRCRFCGQFCRRDRRGMHSRVGCPVLLGEGIDRWWVR